MAGFIGILRSGVWLTRDRIRFVAAILLAFSAIGVVSTVVTATSLNDRLGRPLGTDFSSFYAAGTLAHDGLAAQAYDRASHFAREQAIFGAATQFYIFPYPPFFLLLAAVLAWLSYPAALIIWQSASLALYLLSIRAIVRSARDNPDRLWLLLALAFPVVLINLGHGQNGFLTAGLFGFALVTLERRPLIAGVLFGLLAYKPQFGLMIPLVLVATGQWRAIAAATGTVAALTLATFAAFGPQVWQAFLATTSFTRAAVLEQGGIDWFKMQSVFSWMRMWDIPVGAAYAVQGAVTLAAAAGLVWLWRSCVGYANKAAALAIATLLATPFCFDYDLMLLAPAIAFLAVDGAKREFAPWQKTMLAGLWIMPLLARSVPQATLIPLAVPLMLTALAFLLRRAMSESGTSRFWHFAPRALK
jgi:alpha-1,2-mannosyltransferase